MAGYFELFEDRVLPEEELAGRRARLGAVDWAEVGFSFCGGAFYVGKDDRVGLEGLEGAWENAAFWHGFGAVLQPYVRLEE